MAIACGVVFARSGLPCVADDSPLRAVQIDSDNEQSPLDDLDVEMPSVDGPRDGEFLDSDSADFDAWQSLVDRNRSIYDDPAAVDESTAEALTPVAAEEDPELRLFDYMRHWGFHHSSTEGRFLQKNVPMTYSSWLNRPYHVDWFAGPLLSDDPAAGRVSQSNEILAGLRFGWDFDYYWGLQWRFGWADPSILQDGATESTGGTYMVGDFDLVYYPWGDTKVRPYFQLGLGGTQVATITEDGGGREAWLMSMPFGLGVEFPQTRWLAWRLEIIDNLAFGADGIDTMHNVSFTAGMEYRFGARPTSYWPWRSSRVSW